MSRLPKVTVKVIDWDEFYKSFCAWANLPCDVESSTHAQDALRKLMDMPVAANLKVLQLLVDVPRGEEQYLKSQEDHQKDQQEQLKYYLKNEELSFR